MMCLRSSSRGKCVRGHNGATELLGEHSGLLTPNWQALVCRPKSGLQAQVHCFEFLVHQSAHHKPTTNCPEAALLLLQQ